MEQWQPDSILTGYRLGRWTKSRDRRDLQRLQQPTGCTRRVAGRES